jgi:hypothetical protein
VPILLSKTYTNAVADSPGRWLIGEIVAAVEDSHEFSEAELPDAGNFHHITITDKTLTEVQAYLQRWNHDPTTIQISAIGDVRLLQVSSDMVSVSGKNAFTQAGVDEFIAGLNARYPTANASYDSHINTAFRFNVTVPLAQRDALIDEINQFVRNVQYARRRWATTAAARTFMDANGGAASGTASQVSTYIRDGLLD